MTSAATGKPMAHLNAPLKYAHALASGPLQRLAIALLGASSAAQAVLTVKAVKTAREALSGQLFT